MIKACLNGSRSGGEHPCLPVSAADLATAAAASVRYGAGALHLHPRDAAGTESLDASDCARALQAVRKRCPGIPVGLSTGLWITASVTARLEAVACWESLPDFASVNFSEDGVAELCELLRGRGIGIEAGLASSADADLFLESGINVLRILIEVAGDAVAAIQTAATIEAMLERGRVTAPVLEHGYDDATWPVLARAFARGYDVRVGLEDTLILPDGRIAADNAELVSAAVKLWQATNNAVPGRSSV